eukprot:Selendium_serpulae@DN4655_c0_g1_i4.p1
MAGNSGFGHEPSAELRASWRRSQTPLHYCLRTHDYVAFFSELRRGANPFVRDECGRTALDLVFYMIENLLETSLCTSFPIDHLIDSVSYSVQFPGGFVENVKLMYENMYDRPRAAMIQAMEARDGEILIEPGRPNPMFCPRYPVLRHNCLPAHLGAPTDTKPEDPFSTGINAFHETMIVVADDAMNKPTRKKILTRMNELLRRCQNLQRIAVHLATNDTLLRLAVDYKIVVTETRRPEQNDEKRSPFVLENLTFPYLYMAVLHNLFEMYPHTPFGTKWNNFSVSDARRLINIVMTKQMKAFPILRFLAGLPQHIVNVIDLLGVEFFLPPS